MNGECHGKTVTNHQISLKNHEFSSKNIDFHEKSWKIRSDMKNSIHKPACRFFVINFHRKIIKNHWFSTKKHQKSLLFMKTHISHEKINSHTGVSIFGDPKMIKKLSKITNFHQKNTMFLSVPDGSFVECTLKFSTYRNGTFVNTLVSLL